jgi:hypothetical protein
MMQIGMMIGLAASYPVNVVLIRDGVKARDAPPRAGGSGDLARSNRSVGRGASLVAEVSIPDAATELWSPASAARTPPRWPRSRSSAGRDATLAPRITTDQPRLSGSHPLRLPALSPAAHLLAWKLEIM